MWKIANQDNCTETARRNAGAGNGAWNLEMLTGTGQFSGNQNQIYFPPAAYLQIATAAARAWKTIQGTVINRVNCQKLSREIMNHMQIL